MKTFAIPATVLPNGTTNFPDQSLPVGTTDLQLQIDVSSMVAGQRILLVCQVLDAAGTLIYGFSGDTLGPYTDKHTGLLVTTATMVPGWDTPSLVGWRIKSSVDVTNGPVSISGGSLTVLP